MELFMPPLPTVINCETACNVLQYSMRWNLLDLKKSVLGFINVFADRVLRSDGFLHLSTEALAMILESEDLVATEVEIFFSLVRWARSKLLFSGFRDEDVEDIDVRQKIGDLKYLIRFGSMTRSIFCSAIEKYSVLSYDDLYSHIRYYELGENPYPFKTSPRVSNELPDSTTL